MLTIKPLALAQVGHPAYRQALPEILPYTHQAELYDSWSKHDTFLLATPTGSGKTQAAAFPVLTRSESAIFVYPTNALAQDQERSITLLLDRLGMPYYRLAPEDEWDADAYRRAKAVLVRVEANTVEQFRQRWHRRYKGRAIAELLGHQEKPLLVLTNPDTLFLMQSLRYHSGFEILSRLQGFKTLVIDEFHLYGGVELAKLLFMVHSLLRAEGFFERVIFLSATPQPELLVLFNQLFAPHIIAAQSVPETYQEGRRVLHSVELEFSPRLHIEQIANQIDGLRPSLIARPSDPDFAPLVVILNSVFSAIYLEDLLRRKGWTPDEIGIYRGLSDRAIRDTRGKLIVIGTSAIEVGVDFNAQFLLFEASSGPSFLQRFGRIGRHQDGSAVLYAPGHVVQHAQILRQEIDRDKLARLALLWFGEFDARPWFVATGKGLLACATLLERYATSIGSAEVSRKLLEQREHLISEFATRLGVSDQLQTQIRHILRRPPAWLASYAKAQSFRSSGLSVPVYDVIEASRRGNSIHGHYEADLSVLLERARDVVWRGDHVQIKGFGERQKVTAGSKFEDDEYGIIKPSSQVLPYFLVNGSRHALSDLAQQDEHIVIKVPFAAEAHFDWRIDYYPTTGGYLLFDGGALLAYEICERHGLINRDVP